jgi:hypothetical protein
MRTLVVSVWRLALSSLFSWAGSDITSLLEDRNLAEHYAHVVSAWGFCKELY